MDFFLLVVTSLVCWRVTHLFNKEDGPFEVIYRLRKLAGAGFFGSLLDCFYCLSLWTALPLGIWLGQDCWQKILFWWAISGAACLLEQATAASKKSQDTLPYFKED